jgi:hypothetical protein
MSLIGSFQTVLVNPSAFTAIAGVEADAGRFGVIGSNTADNAFGFLAGSDLLFHQHVGVYGQSDQAGVFGHATTDTGTGVYGHGAGAGSFGVRGETGDGIGVQGRSFGNGTGVSGISKQGQGVVGQTTSDTNAGVNGRNDGNGFGVFGGSLGGSGVEGHSTNGTGVVGFSEHGLAGRFIGNVEVTGDIRLVNADCAEDFDISGAEQVEPGTVMVIDPEGALQPSHHAYDKCVAGVISGAGGYKPGIVLDQQQSQGNRLPVALLGKVYCKVDAQYASVEVGDLLTTSATPGHAMKVGDPLKAFGTVIGKALRPLREGQALIPILIALQ